MPRGSLPGERRGGRQAGTPNRRTLALRAIAEGLPPPGSPLEFLTNVYRNEALPLEVRLEAAGKAAPFVHPRLAMLTVGGDKENPLQTVTRIELVAVEPPPRAPRVNPSRRLELAYE